jgi:hypothetical protein
MSARRTRSCGRFGTGEARLDAVEIECDDFAVFRLRRVGRVEHALRDHRVAHQIDLRLRAARQREVAQRLLVDREDAAGRAVFRSHVGDRRAVGERQARHAGPEELDELVDDVLLAQDLGHRQDEVGRGDALAQLAGQPEADDLRDQHRHRLAEHRGFGFDAADAPPEHAETVDHRGVRVGAHDGVGIGEAVALHHHARQELEVHLVHDARLGRHDLEVRERLLAPAQERVALAVARELEGRVLRARVGRAGRVDLNRVIDDQLRRQQRIDASRITAERRHRRAHRGQVDHGRNPGEVLHQHARGREGDFTIRFGRRIPAHQRFDVGGGDDHAILVSQQVLEQHAQ